MRAFLRLKLRGLRDEVMTVITIEGGAKDGGLNKT